LILLRKFLELPENEEVTGKLSKPERARLLKSVKDSTEPVIMLTTFQVGGTGHNFQKFTVVAFLDRTWNPQVITSATNGRIKSLSITEKLRTVTLVR